MMTVPSREQAAAMLLELDPPDWLLAHSAAVAEVATFLAQRARAAGHEFDLALVEAAALLHDVDKALPATERPALEHGHAGAAWLRARGHAELASAVANHPATRLSDDEHWATWIHTASLEELIVAYADKRAEQDLVPMSRRFASWHSRHPGQAAAIQLGAARAAELERRVCEAAGVDQAEVRREPWTEAVLARAARAGGPR